MLCGTRSTHHQLPAINNRAQWALLMKGEVLLPAVTFLVAFEEGAAGKREGGGHSCRATADQPQWVSWRCQRETKVKTPEALAKTSRSSPSHRSRWNNRNKEYLQHTALIKGTGHTKTCVTVILPQLWVFAWCAEKCTAVCLITHIKSSQFYLVLFTIPSKPSKFWVLWN